MLKQHKSDKRDTRAAVSGIRMKRSATRSAEFDISSVCSYIEPFTLMLETDLERSHPLRRVMEETVNTILSRAMKAVCDRYGYDELYITNPISSEGELEDVTRLIILEVRRIRLEGENRRTA